MRRSGCKVTVAGNLVVVITYLIVPDIWKGLGVYLCLRALPHAGVAQSVEHLICNQGVGGSNPFASSSMQKSGREFLGIGFRQVAGS